MATERDMYRQQSIKALRVGVVLLLVACLSFFVIRHFMAVPLWLISVVIGMLAFAVVGDVINIIVLRRNTRKGDHESKG